jgi:tetratricopeptide (TPR) repeat protein
MVIASSSTPTGCVVTYHIHRKITLMKKLMLYTALFSLLFSLFLPSAMANLTKTVSPDTPEQEQTLQRSADLVNQGQALMEKGAYAAAEKDFKEALVLESDNATADPGLAEALAKQNKITEALQVYRNLIYQYPRNMSSVAQNVGTLMHYAILLSQTGQWKEAVSIYEKALPSAVYHGMPKLDVHFDPQIPMPVQLQAIAHVACGIELSGHGDNPQAFKEYEKGSYLAPDSALVNYYFGDGWQQLSPAEQAKFGRAAQAKAALQKAVRLGKGPVKKAAQKALRMAMKPK